MSRVYERIYHDGKTGKTKAIARWWVAFNDHRRVERRLPGFTDRRATELFAARLDKLASAVANDDPLGELKRWIDGLDAGTRSRLAK